MMLFRYGEYCDAGRFGARGTALAGSMVDGRWPMGVDGSWVGRVPQMEWNVRNVAANDGLSRERMGGWAWFGVWLWLKWV